MTIEQIQKAIEQLCVTELARFRAWFETFGANRFDMAIERDVEGGKLDEMAAQALASHRAGQTRDL